MVYLSGQVKFSVLWFNILDHIPDDHLLVQPSRLMVFQERYFALKDEGRRIAKQSQERQRNDDCFLGQFYACSMTRVRPTEYRKRGRKGCMRGRAAVITGVEEVLEPVRECGLGGDLSSDWADEVTDRYRQRGCEAELTPSTLVSVTGQ